MTEVPHIPGSFTHIDMQAGKPEASHPITKAQAAMVGELARLAAPRIHADPHADEFEDVADYLLRAAGIIDAFFLEVGLEVKSSATTHIEIEQFTDVVKNALDGYATAEIDHAAECIREDHAEIESAIRNRRSASAMVEDIYRAFGMPKRS